MRVDSALSDKLFPVHETRGEFATSLSFTSISRGSCCSTEAVRVVDYCLQGSDVWFPYPVQFMPQPPSPVPISVNINNVKTSIENVFHR